MAHWLYYSCGSGDERETDQRFEGYCTVLEKYVSIRRLMVVSMNISNRVRMTTFIQKKKFIIKLIIK